MRKTLLAALGTSERPPSWRPLFCAAG